MTLPLPAPSALRAGQVYQSPDGRVFLVQYVQNGYAHGVLNNAPGATVSPTDLAGYSLVSDAGASVVMPSSQRGDTR